MRVELKIGAVAKQAGVSVDTVRYYERRGILPEPERRESGYRIYSATTVERIRFTRHLQSLGFNLDEIVLSLKAVDQGVLSCKGQEKHFKVVVDRLDTKIAELQATRRKAMRVLKRCQSGTCTLRDDL